MPLTTKQALARLEVRKKTLVKKNIDLTNLENNYTQLETNYKELQQVHSSLAEHADKLTTELTQTQEDRAFIQNEWSQIQNQLNRAEDILKNYKPETITIGDRELTVYEIEQMERKLKVAHKTFVQRKEAYIKITGLSRRLKVTEKQVNNLAFEKSQLTEKGTELQKRVNEVTEELSKEKTSVGDLEVKLTQLEDLLLKNQREYEEKLQIKQSEWDALQNDLAIIQEEVDKNRLELGKLQKLRDQLLEELAEKERIYQANIKQLEQEKEELERNLREEVNQQQTAREQEAQTFQEQINRLKTDLDNERWYHGEEKSQAQETLRRLEELEVIRKEKEEQITLLNTGLQLAQEKKAELESRQAQLENNLQESQRQITNLNQEKLTDQEKELTTFIEQIYRQYLSQSEDYSNINQLEKATQEIKQKTRQIESTRIGDKYPDYPHLFPYIQNLERQIQALYQHAQENNRIKQHAERLNTQLEKNKEAHRQAELELETKLKELREQAKQRQDQIGEDLKKALEELEQTKNEARKFQEAQTQKILKLKAKKTQKQRMIEQQQLFIDKERENFYQIDFNPSNLTALENQLKERVEQLDQWKQTKNILLVGEADKVQLGNILIDDDRFKPLTGKEILTPEYQTYSFNHKGNEYRVFVVTFPNWLFKDKEIAQQSWQNLIKTIYECHKIEQIWHVTNGSLNQIELDLLKWLKGNFGADIFQILTLIRIEFADYDKPEKVEAEKRNFFTNHPEITALINHLEEQIQVINWERWKNISLDFTKNQVKAWRLAGFTFETCREWINIGLKPNETNFAGWLKSELSLNPEEVLNAGNLEELKAQFNEYQRTNPVASSFGAPLIITNLNQNRDAQRNRLLEYLEQVVENYEVQRPFKIDQLEIELLQERISHLNSSGQDNESQGTQINQLQAKITRLNKLIEQEAVNWSTEKREELRNQFDQLEIEIAKAKELLSEQTANPGEQVQQINNALESFEMEKKQEKPKLVYLKHYRGSISQKLFGKCPKCNKIYQGKWISGDGYDALLFHPQTTYTQMREKLDKTGECPLGQNCYQQIHYHPYCVQCFEFLIQAT